MLTLLLACAPPSGGDADLVPFALLDGARAVVPGDGLPAEAAPNVANNNLDVADHDGRLFLAWRTADTHFAGPEARLVIVSTTDERTWRWEGEIALGTDVREPQLVAIDGELRLYFTVLGADPLDFEPGGVRMTRYRGPGDWSVPEAIGADGLLFWRIKELDGRLTAFGYLGGENVYDGDGEPIRLQVLTSTDGVAWTPAWGGDGTVLTGGGSESDAVFLPDGRLVAVVRNEAGDDDTGFGSKICVAPAGDPGAWDCVGDPRKFDSPLVLLDDGEAWLIARRNLTDDGRYDLGRDDVPPEQRYLAYQYAYWHEPKRCAVWHVDADTRAVTWVMDLPSKGDTCFPEALPRGDRWLVYNYTSDPDGPEVTWFQGQRAPTFVWRQELTVGVREALDR